MNGRRPNGVLDGNSVRAVARPESNHGLRLGKGAMKVPLVTAVIGDEIVNHLVETVPVAAVVSRRNLGTGHGNVPVRISRQHGITHCLVSVGEANFHKRTMVSPGCEIARLHGLFGGERQDFLPSLVIGLPLLVQCRQRTIFLL